MSCFIRSQVMIATASSDLRIRRELAVRAKVTFYLIGVYRA